MKNPAECINSKCKKRWSSDDSETVPGLYIEETVCPYPERTVCDGCPKDIETEDLCEMEL